jgi:hypothetical protein
MPAYAIIENNIVINVVEASQEYAQEQGWVNLKDNAKIGWLYDGQSFMEPPRDIEKEWNEQKYRRDILLKESDTNVLPDRWAVMTPEKQQEWATYRQALRDIPQTFTNPDEVVWPTKPE